MPDLYIWQTNDITSVGPDVFSNTQDANGGAVGVSTFSIAGGATMSMLSVTDDDIDLNDGDASSQVLSAPTTFNGTAFSAGDAIKVDYAYVVRPVGSSNPADNITVYGVKIGNNIEGVVSDGPLIPGVSYDVLSIASNSPTVAYASLYVCFAKGTRLRTPDGEVEVERLSVGALVETLDRGPMPILWIGRRCVIASGPAAPVVFAAGTLGNRRELVVSQQHRVLMRMGAQEVLVAAKALVGLPGVEIRRGGSVEYFHVLLQSHQILQAEGALVESFNPGPQAWSVLGRQARGCLAALRAVQGTSGRPMALARPVVGPRAWQRAHAGSSGRLAVPVV